MELRRDGYIFSVPGKCNYVEKITAENKQGEIDAELAEIRKHIEKVNMLGLDLKDLETFIEKVYKENEK